ncbi:TRAP transporter substrate-binding protein [Psychrobacter lutiphocae]|uniref:TRAP transporter substrate-binding protein n=1 Tax=Psychrobacter lutiphocae TaxID=540500 RepID=UPI0003816037|nr:TRAP transporter substrate-binding protein [Psychrobacter lutiphocae]
MKKLSCSGMVIATLLALGGCNNADTAAETNAAPTSTQTILRFSHLWPATGVLNQELFEPWAKKIEEDSDGRLKIEIYPSSSLSKPDNTYDATVKGVVDIGAQVPGYVSGRFPLTEITQLPGLSTSSSQLNCILQTLYDDDVIASEYEDTHPLFMMAAGPGILHTSDKLIEKPEDMVGMRIRGPSIIAINIIESAGGTPVGLPAPDQYNSLQRGVIDGVSFTWDGVGAFRLNELLDTHTDIPLYSPAIFVTMNKDKYESLPDDLKKVIDDNSGASMSRRAGEIFDSEDKKHKDEAIAKGDALVTIPDPLNDPRWKDLLTSETEKYLKEASVTGIDAHNIYRKAQQASRSCKT